MKTSTQENNRRTRPKVLVVEEDAPDVEGLSLVLSEKYDVIRATECGEALHMVENEDPELILFGSDLPLEKENICKTIKNKLSNELIPVIVVTHPIENEQKAKFIKENADEILIKPVDELELTTRVRSLLRMRHLHDELVKERDEIQEYIDVAGSIIGVVDRNFRVTLVNQKACDVLGYSKEEVLGQNWFDVFIPEYIRNEIKKGYLGVINGTIEPPEFSEKPIITRNKGERWVLWHDVVLRDESMNITGTISSGDDITERKLAENAMEEANTELKLLNKIKDQFLTNLNYELRTPLISIKGFCELLMNEELGTINDSQKNALDTVLRNTERLRHLIDSLLYVSGERTQKIKYNIIPLYPARLLEDIIEDRTLYAEKKELTIESHVPKNLPAILGDMEHLERMFTHLLDNAIKFTSSGGRITISATHYDDTVEVKITDTGIGIPEDVLPNIFSSFYQVDGSTRRKYGGTGVGLHICKKIIEAHMGEIFVESEVGVGTTFTVLLPV